ncbi:MAG: Ig-like domain-containing protein [Mangrovibacterium sp.]
MSTIINTYPVFESNQVLTSKQMNSLVGYLEQQTRLTRAKLIGMGVVCGLEVGYDATANKLTISKGTGITSEGFLINLGDCVTVKYRPYQLPAATVYEPFVNAVNEQDITLYELLTEKADDGPDVFPLNDEIFLGDKVVLLFIEISDKDLKSCLGKSCDELGKERSLTIRKLLISIDDLQTVWDRTNTGKPDAVFSEKYDLPIINLPRALFDPSAVHSSDYAEFSKLYAHAVLSVFDDLFDALAETYDIYRPLLLESYDEQNPFMVSALTEKIGAIRNLLEDADPTYNSYLGVQYVYDLFVDLILAYNEFRVTAFELMSECSSDMSRFPKHLMLGKATGEELLLCELSEYRHHFVQPPIYNHQKQLIKRTISLHNRMVLMLESFDIDRINGLGEAVFPIRITPSLEKQTPLSLRSIPWYYDLNLESFFSHLGNLKDYWNDAVNRTCPLEEDGLVLNYEDQEDDQTIMESKLFTPLYYDIQDYSFLRIEGYINKSIDQALATINDLKNKFNLPFDLIPLQLDPDAGTLQLDYSYGFEDIQEDYRMARFSLCSMVHDLEILYKFVDENQDSLFDGDDDDTKEILQRIKELLGMLVELCQILTECVQEFDFVKFREIYKKILQYIIDFFLIEHDLLNEIKIKEGEEDKQIPLVNGIIQRLFPLAHKLADLLFYSKFFRIYYAFKRREFYLRKGTAVFSSFIQRHPGIDHQAGVRKGGTFILVYKNAEDNSVVADFNLPYSCCGKENGVPMCDDGSFTMEILPFARPDYAVTTIAHAVEIDVMLNDYQVFGSDFVIESEKTSEFGGDIHQHSETGPLTYKPNPEFSGTDSFTYTLIDKRTGLTDSAKVTIRVKKADTETQGCYNADILRCWGEDRIHKFLSFINLDPGQDPAGTLLDYLRRNRGFSAQEIDFLIETGSLFMLLHCIFPDLPDDIGNEQMKEIVADYQQKNCQGRN